MYKVTELDYAVTICVFAITDILFVGICLVLEDGDTPMELDVFNFKGPGVALAMYNIDEVSSILLVLLSSDGKTLEAEAAHGTVTC
ncbi:hypothetical protein RIF29_19954 [Crotalaria pallida]|uniref:Uncharacterized protein n=1 Tax=Crotalaria pallida TaxID=3830 RepID=A0AAN9F0B0_CROPI